MNFLPFVFTFLLLLTLVTSFLFKSHGGTVREHKMIQSQHEAYLAILSEQNTAQYHKCIPKKKKDPPPETPPKKETTEDEEEDDDIDETKAPRTLADGCEKSKLNLTTLVHGQLANKLLEQTAIRLIENLYGSCEFYVPGAAQAIVKQMMKDKIESFEELKLKTSEHNEIYYKMVQGTSSGYPALSEYLSLSKTSPMPIYFRYASKPVLRAALGEKCAETVFDLERKKWEQNRRCKAMVKEEFLKLAQKTISMDEATAFTLFNFDNKDKGLSQVQFDATGKIRAFHPAEKTER